MRRFALFVLLALGPLSATFAQTFPTRPIRILVGFAPGGNSDLVARAVAQPMGEGLGQPVLVENRPSASGLVASQAVARAAPDGYLLLHVSNTFAMVPSVMANPGYDPIREFTGVSATAVAPKVLDVAVSFPANSIKELIAIAKAKPGALSYASAGVGGTSHMAAELFSRRAGIKMLHVPYKGNAQALVDVSGGQVTLLFDEMSSSIPLIRSGKVKVLAVTSAKRSALFPDIPTVGEAGLPGFEDVTFNGLVAPAAVPREVLARLSAEVARAVRLPEARTRLLDLGVELMSSTPEEFTAAVKAEYDTKARVAREADIRMEN